MCCVATSASSAYSATSASCAMPAPRLEGTECGLKVLPLASQRVYFVEPRARPDGPHDDEKKGTWRQPVIAPCAYLPSAEDRARTFVRNATSEQSMGAHSHTYAREPSLCVNFKPLSSASLRVSTVENRTQTSREPPQTTPDYLSFAYLPALCFKSEVFDWEVCISMGTKCTPSNRKPHF